MTERSRGSHEDEFLKLLSIRGEGICETPIAGSHDDAGYPLVIEVIEQDLEQRVVSPIWSRAALQLGSAQAEGEAHSRGNLVVAGDGQALAGDGANGTFEARHCEQNLLVLGETESAEVLDVDVVGTTERLH
jgi:hypothetical protein